MILHVSFGSECFLALRAFVWFLIIVQSHMNLQVWFSLERLVADITLKFLLLRYEGAK